MSGVDTAAADRLPWLPDEPSPARASRWSGSVLPLAAITALVVAAGIFWLGTRSVNTHSAQQRQHIETSTTVRLPAPRPVEQQLSIPAQPEVRPVAVPEVRPAPVHEVRIVSLRATKSRGASVPRVSVQDKSQTQSSPVPVSIATPQFVLPRPWNPRVLQGASGRVVQIGAFGTTHQAKRGWWFMVRAYPAVAHLPAVVRTSRNSRGRAFFRFQVGTTSQAHSEVLCQRMQRIGLSCAVVGLPWKAKVER